MKDVKTCVICFRRKSMYYGSRYFFFRFKDTSLDTKKRLMERCEAANNLWTLTEISKKSTQQRKKNAVHLIEIYLH